jgi:hypothetical protein
MTYGRSATIGLLLNAVFGEGIRGAIDKPQLSVLLSYPN